ncbi:hypothetical protein GCM10011374_41070 [Kocuria dechangensis]|uniref:Pentapeptide repeat-containing protein n=1 Tax=Kocuria dechangensis TaxID=1176249 RepID=A0A917M0X6_9MICC|nr:pentapeptide repeat-containing protein [Kocuria dechangensis]GGG72102.1 hypothetical protein GCM10011374_41070 [Kocuria dechangensis]
MKKYTKGSWKTFLKDPPWWFKEVIIAVFLSLLLLSFQNSIEQQREINSQNVERQLATQAERQENVRFIREKSSPDNLLRQFSDFDISGQSLNGLILFEADFSNTNLSSASLRMANLSRSLFSGADMRGADLRGADLSYSSLNGWKKDLGPKGDESSQQLPFVPANLSGARLEGATFSGAKLFGVDFSGSSVQGANLEGACHDESTTWPAGFTPPPSRTPPHECGIFAIPRDIESIESVE